MARQYLKHYLKDLLNKLGNYKSSQKLTVIMVVVLAPLCSDINGVPRPTTGAWDVGAFQ
jgi:hypothetical protein